MPAAMLERQSSVASPVEIEETEQKEYRRLLRAARMARGRFALFPIESNLSAERKDALLKQFRADLEKQGQRLRVVTLSHDCWQLLDLPEMETPVEPNEVILVQGLEDTPNVIQVLGTVPQRPPFLALLNHQRKTLRQCIPAPFLLWCPPYAYDALMVNAPDFFDQFVGLFHFLEDIKIVLQASSSMKVMLSQSEREPTISSPALIPFYREKLAEYPEPTLERAFALVQLAHLLMSIRSGDLASQMEEARSYAMQAIRILAYKRSKQARYAWASANNSLGVIYYSMPTGSRTGNLRKAVIHFNRALRYCTEIDQLQEWAATQNNLGNAYANIFTRNHTNHLHKAIACYKASLRVRTEANFPQEWAATLNNLGNAYRNLPREENDANFVAAIECYVLALKVRTEVDFPQQWAMTQNNLGIAYANLTMGDRVANIAKAMACYAATLRVYTKSDFPQEWAMTTANIGRVFAYQGKLTEAKIFLSDALSVFRQIGHEHHAEKCARKIADLEKQEATPNAT